MQKLMTFFLPLFACISQLQAEIVEISNFKEVHPHITDDALVLLDIDDTLMINVQMMGTDEWFHHRMNFFIKLGLTASEALEKAVAEDEAIQHVSEMRIVEHGTEAIVDELQKQGCLVMGLTTRGFGIAKPTIRQLLELKIDLSKSAPSQHDHYAQSEEHGVLYRKGILFTGGTHKGEALFRFCSAIGLRPRRIVFVNDKATHLAQVEETAKKQGVPFLGLRYGYSDSRKAAFQLEIAECQFRHSPFQRLLSDEEAMVILQAR
jgi:hypothetical protein